MTIIIPGRPARPIVVEGETAPTVTVQPGRDLPPGGTVGQALIKASDSDFATAWGNRSAAARGGITGALSAQTDLQGALDAKQATLVSGVNIKTLNRVNHSRQWRFGYQRLGNLGRDTGTLSSPD